MKPYRLHPEALQEADEAAAFPESDRSLHLVPRAAAGSVRTMAE
jgi:hypothetical protein